MAPIFLIDVTVKEKHVALTSPYELEITFECSELLKDDLDWKLTYHSADDNFEYKTELDSLLLGPIPIGASKFTFHCDPPDVKRIPDKALLGIVGLRLSCDYLEQEFVSVGYYVENDYDDPLMKEIPPSKPDYGQIMRTILAEKPIVTVFSIQWDTDRTPLWGHPPPQPDADAEKNDEASYGTEEGEDQAATTHGTEDDKAAIAGGEDLATQDTSFSSGEDDGNTSDACDMDSDSAQGEEE